MKIFWLINGILPDLASHLELSITGNNNGHIISQLETLKGIGHEMHICTTSADTKKFVTVKINDVYYYIIPSGTTKMLENPLRGALRLVNPDVIHIWGTENIHSQAMLNISPLDKTVLSIQDVVSEIAKNYPASLPINVAKSTLFKDVVTTAFSKWWKGTIVEDDINELSQMVTSEIETIRKTKNIIGRTVWDKVIAEKFNGDFKYYHYNEIAQAEFYGHTWDVNKCDKYSIFLNQGDIPPKGLHIALEALSYVLKKFPCAHLYVSGDKFDVKKRNKIIQSIINYSTGYKGYIRQLIDKLSLRNNITFLGQLSVGEIKDRYLMSNVFILPSSIESSPISLVEAMLVGTPVVASNVGGVAEMLSDKEEGLLYPYSESHMLAYNICNIFSDNSLATKLSQTAKKHAELIHNRDENTKKLLDIYKEIAQ